MDYHSFDSEVIESLNVLRPPVKREGKSDSQLGPFKNIQVLSCTSNCGNLLSQGQHGDTSTSLILEKTSKSQILKQYSVVNYQNQQGPLDNHNRTKFNCDKKNKPLIKVTVIPRNCVKADSKLLRKRRLVSKAIQGTSSDHNNSIQTKNVYLVVAGRKEDKIYEIKTTGSAKFEKIRDDTVVRNHIFHNFTMEKKKKKDAKKESKSKKKEEVVEEFAHVCHCCPGDGFHDTEVSSVKPGKSRVKIFGKLGLTQNDKYVLKCHATVDDKPVSSFLSQEQLSYDSVPDYNEETVTCSNAPRISGIACVRGGNENRSSNYSSPRAGGITIMREDQEAEFRAQRDSVIQADFRLKAVNDLLMDIENKYKIRKESQSTQVDLTQSPNSNYYQQQPRCLQTLHTRCVCNPEYPKISAHEEKNLKACQSPLVIISVFPKQENNVQFDFLKAVQEERAENQRLSSLTFQENKMNTAPELCRNTTPELNRNMTTDFNKSITHDFDTLRSEEKHVISKKKKSKSRSPSPRSRSTSPKSPKAKTKELKEFKQERAKVKAKVEQKTSTKQSLLNSKPSKDTNKRKASQRTKSPDKPNKPTDKPTEKPSKIPKSPKSKAKRKVDKAINTEHVQTKKALVDSYTRTVLDQTNRDKPALSVSKVSVNIDSGNDVYDLTFQQDRTTADLCVRKTTKGAPVPHAHEGNRRQRVDSMENLFPRHRAGKSAVVQSVIDSPSKKKNSIHETNVRRLTLRDSLEISHRREDRVPKMDQGSPPRTHKHVIQNEDETDSSVPVRHYPGDSCVVCDPIARDKEIRRLLGVPRITNSNFISHHPIPGVPISRCCLYPFQCNKTLTTAIAIPKNDRYPGTNRVDGAPCPGTCSCKRSFKLIEIQDRHVDVGRIYSDSDSSQCGSDQNIVQSDLEYDDRETSPECIHQSVAVNSSYLKDASVCEPEYQENICQTDPINISYSVTELPENTERKKCCPHKDDGERKPVHPCARKSCRQKVSEEVLAQAVPETNSCSCSDNVNSNEADQQVDGELVQKKDCVCVASPSNDAEMADAGTLYESPQQNVKKKHKRKECNKHFRCVDSLEKIPKNDCRMKTTRTKETTKTFPVNECIKESHMEDTSATQQLTLNRNVQVFLQMEQFSKQKPIVLSRKQYKKVKKTIQRTLSARDKAIPERLRDAPGGKYYCKCKQSYVCTGEVKEKSKGYTPVYFHQEVQTERNHRTDADTHQREHSFRPRHDTIVLFSNEDRCAREERARRERNKYSRHAVSSVEIRYASIAFRKQDAVFSSTNVASNDNLSYPRRHNEYDSFQTIFRGHRKSVTPNLGTSALSLQSEVNISESQSLMVLPDTKAKKPFLKRLISCLVMRTRTSDVDQSGQIIPTTSKNSSVDSYHISTSFGAIEMSSSLYDTSASFSSDHGIYPLNSKLKRSFFSSVRGFLASRSKS